MREPWAQTCLVRFAVSRGDHAATADRHGPREYRTAPGYGHVFAADDYMDAWLAVLEPEGWTGGKIARLKTLYASDRQHVAASPAGSSKPFATVSA